MDRPLEALKTDSRENNKLDPKRGGGEALAPGLEEAASQLISKSQDKADNSENGADTGARRGRNIPSG